MHQPRNPDLSAHGNQTYIKKILTRPSLDTFENQRVDSYSGSPPNLNGLRLQGALPWEPHASKRGREPEFIETDFTSPLTEISRPLSLNANDEFVPREMDIHPNLNKRPYSANQISDEVMLSKSITFLNVPKNYSATCQDFEKIKLSEDTSKYATFKGSHVDKVPTFALGNPSSNNTSFSQKTSPMQSSKYMAQNNGQKFVSLLSKTCRPRISQPNLIPISNISTNMTFTKITQTGKPHGVALSNKNIYVPSSPYPLKCDASLESLPVGAVGNAPLNLSSKGGPRKSDLYLSDAINFLPDSGLEIVPKTCEPSTPLNLICKRGPSNLPNDLSLHAKPPKKLGGSSLSTASGTNEMNISQSTYSEEFFDMKNQANKTSNFVNEPSNFMPSTESAAPSASIEEITSSKIHSSNDENVSSDFPVKLQTTSSNHLNSSDVSLKEEVESYKSLEDNEEHQPLESDDGKFIWDDYLEYCKATAVPSILFRHVESSLQNGLKKGMMLEVANKDSTGTFWVASIIMSCGQLLMLRPACCQTGTSLDFWCDMSTYELHPVGWCAANRRQIGPPKDLADKVVPDWKSALQESLVHAVTPPSYMLDQKTGSLPFDEIHVDMTYEIEHEADPQKLWYARVVKNVGGRLLLQYEGSSDAFWLFYTDCRLHPLGYSTEQNKQSIVPPFGIIKNDSESQMKDIKYDVSANNSPPARVFEDREVLEKHNFQEGWRLELLDTTFSALRVVHVSKVVDEFYFIVESDEVSPSTECRDSKRRKFCCHQNSSIIFPVGWHKDHDVKLLPVPGYDAGHEFDLSMYLNHFGLKPAPSENFNQAHIILSDFEKGMKLEATDARRPDEISAATIEDIKGPLLWIKLDHDPSFKMIVPYDSHEIFPIGWCESNNYQLKAPLYKSPSGESVPLQDVVTNKNSNGSMSNAISTRKSSGWCPKIYFNTKCYSGPFLSKWRLHNLPKSIGPGSVVSVMTTVITKLIASAYKSSRVLRELQLDSLPNPGMHQQVLKTKYNMKTYSATVEICTSAAQVDQYCKDLCRRLICCPNLISTHSYPSVCPENCLKIAKSKHYFHFGERRKQIGRPRGGHSNIEHFTPEEQNSSSHKRKRKYKKKLLLTLRKKHGSNSAPTRSGTSEAEASSSEIALKYSFANVNGVQTFEDKDSENFDLQINNESPKPCESVTKLKIICNQEKEDGNKSYVVLSNSKEDLLLEKPPNLKKRKRDDNNECKKPKEVVERKYEVRTRGISLTKNYSFEKKSHKKIFIIPPMPPVNHVSLVPQAAEEPTVKQNTKNAFLHAPLQLQKTSEGLLSSLKLTSNPADWSVQQVTEFIKMTDCSKLSKTIRDQEIDGKSLLLLTLPTVQEFIEPKLGPAVKLCDLIERLRRAFFSQYANTITI